MYYSAHTTRVSTIRSRRRRRSSCERCAAGKHRTSASSGCDSPFLPPPFAQLSPFPGSASQRRPDAAHRPQLHLQSTFRNAEGDVAGGWRRHWLARPWNCRPSHYAKAVIGETSAVESSIWSPGVFIYTRSSGEVNLKSGKCRLCTPCVLGP